MGLGGGENAARNGRIMFDGDRARSGSPGRTGSSAVYAGTGSRDKRAGLRLSEPHRRRIGGHVPSPTLARHDGTAGVPSVGQAAPQELSAFQRFQQSLYSSVYPVLGRLGWGARRGKGASRLRNPYRMTVHHTEGHRTQGEGETARSIRDIQHYHMVGRTRQGKQPFSDIGYHFLIDCSGRIAEGRPSHLIGSHAGRRANRGNFGIALMGQFDKQRPSPQQLDSLKRLAVFLAARYGMDPARSGTIEGHSFHKATSCPGRHLLAALPSLRASVSTDLLALKRQGGPKDGQRYASFVPLTTVEPAAA